MASKRQKLKLSKRSSTSDCNDSKLDSSSSTKDKSFNDTSCKNDGNSSFTSNGRQNDIFKKLRQQLQDLHANVQPPQFSKFPVFKVNNVECSHNEALNNYESKWTPFPEFCSNCATDVHCGITDQLNAGSSETNDACTFSQLINHFHQEHLNNNQSNCIEKLSNFNPGTPHQRSLLDVKKPDCMISPDLFTCQSPVEPKPIVNKETNGKAVAKTLFPLPNAQNSSSSDNNQQGESSLIKQCPICQEVFSPQMTLRARSTHIEVCLDTASSDIWEDDS
ncbi:uncharacterized protein LOC115220748 [Octopus sinensis]|uniref:Uncharacterized protein LOC115220748 n=1 Tax=Octopus sinensis TaxID=2607531 RepID=A0A6P7TAL2_9MOLL|nr:uncharacterized protein LOC115220748 [Octopus sinensis]